MAKYAVRLIAPVLLGALILLFPADGLRALGLGEARVDSWLGQPLDVSIRLLEVESEAIESISVGPASLADHERLGVPSESLALGLEVTVDRRVDPPRVRVRSSQPANDPVVQILIDARWSSGRVLREYTLFLDPPVVDSPPPVRRVSEPAEAPAAEPRPAPEAAPVREAPARQPAQPDRPDESRPQVPARGGETVTVVRGDTLWSIASDWRTDASLSMDQVMLAIFNRNREAFLGENINRLLSDAQLTMPELDEVRSVDRAEAERRVRDHMRSWQPAASDDVPVVSTAAMPESVAEPAAGEASSEEEAETAYRLDVVPPEEDEYSDGSAVSDGEIRRVQSSLTEVEDEILAEGLESEEFDQRIGEVREALEQRDLAGLAVAEESLAELQSRLREVREARAEESRLAQSADAEGGEGADDEVADYLRQLEQEFDAGTGDESSADDDMFTDDEALAEAEPAGDEAAGQAEEPADAAMRDAEPAADEAGAEDQRPMAVTRTSSGRLSDWLWPAIGVLLVIGIAVGVWMWLRGRQSDQGGVFTPTSGDAAVDSARAAVARQPSDLSARLALLKLLAERGREEEFTDAFDQMYQEVDDESAPEWQEALSLAAAHAPEHPLLRPHETPLDEADSEFGRREDQMLGMFDVDEDEDRFAEAQADDEIPEPERDDTFDLGLDEDESGQEPSRESEPERAAEQDEDEGEESFDMDMDLAVLSERLDDPSKEPGQDKSFEGDSPDANFDEFEEIDEYSEQPEASPAAPDTNEPERVPEDQATAGPELDLDFEPAREQESDEIFGESGTREKEDLDLEFTAEASGEEDLSLDDSLELTPDELEQQEPADSEAEPVELDEADQPESEHERQPEQSAEAGGGSLSDEDADVKLDLARAYISVDLADSARAVLEEVVADGSAEKREEAQKLLDDL